MGNGGLVIGDGGLGIGPNPQSPIPNPQSSIQKFVIFKLKIYFNIFFNLCLKIFIKLFKINHKKCYHVGIYLYLIYL